FLRGDGRRWRGVRPLDRLRCPGRGDSIAGQSECQGHATLATPGPPPCRTRKEYDKAITDYSEVIKLDPRNVGADIARGVAHHHRKEFDQAIADNEAVLRIDPKDALALSNRGNAYGGKGDYARAIRDNEEALRLNPKADYAHNYLAWLLASCPR